MTKREQERCDAALSYLKDSKLDLPQVVKASSYFIAGAEWSDKTMIEKILKWLKAHIKFETVTYSDVWDVSVVDILATDFTTVDEMEESLRKAMEE